MLLPSEIHMNSTYLMKGATSREFFLVVSLLIERIDLM